MSIEGDTLYRRAAALCIVAGREHLPEAWPCADHIAEARRELSAPAVPGASGGPASTAALGSGVSDDTNNRRERELPAAEGATAIAQTESMS